VQDDDQRLVLMQDVPEDEPGGDEPGRIALNVDRYVVVYELDSVMV